MKEIGRILRLAAIVAIIALCVTGGTRKLAYTPRDKAFYADPALVNFVRPGLNITINSAQISSTGTITVTYTLTDGGGMPLDATGATTPGVVSLAYEAAYIPKGQTQYVAYTTSSVTGAVLGTVTRPDFELGSPAVALGAGQYQYTFQAKAPASFDPTATTTVGVDGNRALTSFGLGTSYAGATYNFVPSGATVTVTRDVIRTASCATCHDTLAFHGGYANGVEMCVLCHQPQNVDPTSGNSLDLKVMIHKIHAGSSLPSVVGTTTTPGVPYIIYGYMNSPSNFSAVVDPANIERCEVCHSQKTGAVQSAAYKANPTRVACGSCHDNVNFTTGVNHAAGPQADDSLCNTCHQASGTPFDASITGAHVIASDTAATYPQNPNTLIKGEAITITKVTNTSAGQKPIVSFTVKDTTGAPLALSALEDISFTLAGPTTDYGYTSFGSAVTTPGYDTEDGSVATCDTSGSNCVYTFLNAIPAKATGTYAIAVESEILENILTGTTLAQQVESGTQNQVVYFSVDGSPVVNRRTVVQQANCNQCHVHITGHGARRNDPEYCIMCHNPSLTDASTRAQSTNPTILAQPAQALNFNFLVHRIHTGVNLAAMDASYIEITHNGKVDNFSNTLYPTFNAEGSPGFTQACLMCHLNSSEQTLPDTANNVVDGQYYISPTPPISSACSGCHADKASAIHFASNTTTLGESCDVCHGTNGAYSVGSVHAQ